MRWAPALAVAVLVAACAPSTAPPAAGPASASRTAASPSPSPPAAAAVVLGQLGTVSQQPQISHVVALGLDGAVLAAADFAPPPNVDVGRAAVVYPPPIRVAGGRAYFVDGAGKLQQLTAHGPVGVATIPLPSSGQWTLSFGVSGDGQHVAAAVNRFEGGSAGADVYRADGGGTARLLGHLPGPTADRPPSAVVVEGFDGDSVVAAVDTYAAVQNDPYPAGHEWMGGRLVTLTATGSIGNSYGGADCKPYRWFGDRVVCADQLNPESLVGVTVRRGDGTVLMRVQKVSGCAVPSPDGKRLAARGELWSADGTASALPIDACPLAWLDDAHLLATADAGGGPFTMTAPFVLTIADSTRKPLGQSGYFAGLASI